MKRAYFLPLLLAVKLFALPLGNPMDSGLYQSGLLWGDRSQASCCDAWDMRIGFYGDYVFNRHMELKKRGNGNIDDFEIYTNAVYLALNICHRLDIFTTLGGTKIALTANPKVFGNTTDNTRLSLETETAFSWGIGGRLTIWRCNCWYVGIEGQYFYTKPDVTVVEIPGTFLTYPDNETDLKYSEWQAGIGAAYLIQVGCSGVSVIPYTGLKWSGACTKTGHSDLQGQVTLHDLDNDKYWGFAVGTTLLFCDAVGLTVEGRWGDEKAVHINSQFLF